MTHGVWLMAHDLQLSKHKLHISAFHFFKFLSKSYDKRAKKIVIYVLFLAQKYHIVCFTSRFRKLYPSLHSAWCGDLIFVATPLPPKQICWDSLRLVACEAGHSRTH